MSKEDDATRRGSSVMRAGTSIDREWLLDELEFRLTRCSTGLGAGAFGVRRGGALSSGEQAHRIARHETRSFWNEHRLSERGGRVASDFVEGLLERPSRYLAWSVVPLLTELLPQLRSDELIERVVSFVTDGEPVERVVRDAIALTIVEKWFAQRPVKNAVEQLQALCESDNPERIRMGCIAMGSYVRDTNQLDRTSVDVLLRACLSVAERADAETAIAVGWAIRELISLDEERLLPIFEQKAHLLSRQAFRTAVERLNREARQRLTLLWRRKRLPKRADELEAPSTQAPRSIARKRRLY